MCNNITILECKVQSSIMLNDRMTSINITILECKEIYKHVDWKKILWY